MMERVKFGIEELINKNWRSKIGKRRKKGELDWRIELHSEFVKFAEKAAQLAETYEWDFWGGGVNNYAVTLSKSARDRKSVSIRICSSNKYSYFVSFTKAWNPNNIEHNEYKELIGQTMEEALEYLHTYLDENKYIRESSLNRICVMGGAYDRYPLALIWAKQELDEEEL